MTYHLYCWKCRAKIEAEVYVSVIVCDECLSAPARERAAEDTRLAAYALSFAPEIREAIKMVKLANEHAFTFAHPAYRSAEKQIMALDTAEATIVLHETGGLKPVIGRGLRAS